LSTYQTDEEKVSLPADDADAPRVPSAPRGVERKVRIAHLHEMKRIGRPIAMATAYDATMAAIADEGGMDIVLVGDSVGMVVHGFETTIPVTMEMMEMHVAAVGRGAKRSLIVADMPFLSYQTSVEDAVRNAGRLVQAGAEAVKLEGFGERVLESVKAIVESGMPVMGHIGLVPQSVHALSGYRVQGRTEEDAERICRLARAQQEAGAFAIVAECIPASLAAKLAKELAVPLIGIGSGDACDGQVLVSSDFLGLTAKPPRFARKYVDLRAAAVRAFRKYGRDVRERLFPGDEETLT